MPDPPPNSPIDIRALALYDIDQWKTTEKSHKNYEQLCEVLGNEAISYEEYEKLFNKYLEESYNSTRDGSSRGLPIPDIRGCILSDVINGKPAEKSIDDLSDAYKYHKIDKEDHDYWFKRFDSGHLFNRITFSDLPEDVISEIVERCDIESYFNLRDVSHGLRTVIDQLAPPCTKIEVYSNRIYIYFVKTDSYQQMEGIENRMESLSLLLENAKLRLEYFKIYSGCLVQESNSTQTVISLLNLLDHKIHVKNCSISADEPKDLIDILRCLKPGTLEIIDIFENSLDSIDTEIVGMDQWKQAKNVTLHCSTNLYIHNFYHFSTFNVFFEHLSTKDLVLFCKNISKSSTFKSCIIETLESMNTEPNRIALNLAPSPDGYFIRNSNISVQFPEIHVLKRMFIQKFE